MLVSDPNISRNLPMPLDALPKRIAFVDLETTGGRLNFDRIIEVGLVLVDDNQVIKTFKSLINPGVIIPPEILSLTNILPTEVEVAPSFGEIAQELSSLLENAVFVAHNVRFDYSFLKKEFLRFGINFSPKHFCTVKLSRKLYPQHRHHNLDSIIERFGLECANRHRAFDDAFILWQFYQAIQKQFSVEDLLPAIASAMNKPSRPINIPEEVLEKLPDYPGVYIFYGSNGSVLYVGKSKNIRDRVLSHFAQDHESNTEMKIAQQIQSIETIETAGELGALLLESTLVKKLQPLFNRKLRSSQRLVMVKSYLDNDGYQSIKLVEDFKINPDELDSIIGVFKSLKMAKDFLIYASKQHQLCDKRLNIEKTSSSCFGYRLGACRGACVGKEDTTHYNLRFINAFVTNRFKSWPFNGPIIIKEANPITNKKDYFVIDKWCLIQSSNDHESSNHEISFDLDAYKILRSYLKSDSNYRKINTSVADMVQDSDDFSAIYSDF